MIKIPIPIEKFYEGLDKMAPLKTAERMFMFLKNHKHLAYSITDLQIELGVGYPTLNAAIRKIKTIKEYSKHIQMKWFREAGGKRIYYAYKEILEDNKTNDKNKEDPNKLVWYPTIMELMENEFENYES